MMFLKSIIFVLVANIVVCASALNLQEASAAFAQASCDFSQAPFFESGDYLFVKVQFPLADAEDEDSRDELELSATLDALTAFVKSGISEDVIKTPFCGLLSSFITFETEYSFEGVASCVVKDDSTASLYSTVIAFDLKALLKIKDRAQNERSQYADLDDAGWAQKLRDVFKIFSKKSADQKDFYFLLGAPVVNLIYDPSGSGDYGKDFVSAKTLEEPIFAESCAEMEDILMRIRGEVGFFSENKNLLWSTNVQKRNSLFHSAWGDGTKQLEEAKRLYKLGRDLPRIFSLLCESIALNPVHAEKWKYLGGALRAKGLSRDAVVAYIQSLRLDAQDENAWKGLLRACQQAELKRHAEGLKWYLHLN